MVGVIFKYFYFDIISMGIKTKNLGKRVSKYQLKKGIRHGRHLFKGVIDGILGNYRDKYSLADIRRGYIKEPAQISRYSTQTIGYTSKKVVPPKTNYGVGRYMDLGNMLLESGIRNTDVEASLAGVSIFNWLGQGKRKSVQNRVVRAYERAKEIAKEHQIPLSIYHNRSSAVMSSSSRNSIESYIRDNIKSYDLGIKKLTPISEKEVK